MNPPTEHRGVQQASARVDQFSSKLVPHVIKGECDYVQGCDFMLPVKLQEIKKNYCKKPMPRFAAIVLSLLHPYDQERVVPDSRLAKGERSAQPGGGLRGAATARPRRPAPRRPVPASGRVAVPIASPRVRRRAVRAGAAGAAAAAATRGWRAQRACARVPPTNENKNVLRIFSKRCDANRRSASTREPPLLGLPFCQWRARFWHGVYLRAEIMQTEEVNPEALDEIPILNPLSNIEMTVKEEIEQPVELAEKTNVLLNECMSTESTSQFSALDEHHHSFEDSTIGHRYNSPIDNIRQIHIPLPRDRILNSTHESSAPNSTLAQSIAPTTISSTSQQKTEKERGRGKRRSRWKLKFHHQALPPEYLDHYEAQQAAAAAAAAAATKPANTKADSRNKGNSASKSSSSVTTKSPTVDKTDKNENENNSEPFTFHQSDSSQTTTRTPTHLPEEPGSTNNSALPGGYIYWPSAGVFVHPMALQSQFLYYQKMGAIPLVPLSSAEPQAFMPSHVPHVNLIPHLNSALPQSPPIVAPKLVQKKDLKASANKTLIPKAFSMMMDTSPKATTSIPSSEIPFSRLKRLAPLGNPPSSTAPTKRKRSAIFIPPMPSENSTNPTTE
ncbi:Uncharacterized protein GBIM_17885, partial [Gryllus bimaculatus]